VPGAVRGPGRGGRRELPGLCIERSFDHLSEIIHERPGVYSSYDASAVVSGGRAARTVGVAARAVRGDVGKVMTLTGYTAGVVAFGEDAAESHGMRAPCCGCCLPTARPRCWRSG
jgi:hypothetical protein